MQAGEGFDFGFEFVAAVCFLGGRFCFFFDVQWNSNEV
jgi:hypothetical protein